MKFTINVTRDQYNKVRKWRWQVFESKKAEDHLAKQHAERDEYKKERREARARGEIEYPFLFRYLDSPTTAAFDYGTALTAASAHRKAKKAAKRHAGGNGAGRFQYKTKGEDREDLLDTIAQLEDELGL